MSGGSRVEGPGAVQTSAALTQLEARLSPLLSLLLFWLATDAAQSWVEANLTTDRQTFGNALVVEWRYAEDLARGMAAGGLVVRPAIPGRH